MTSRCCVCVCVCVCVHTSLLSRARYSEEGKTGELGAGELGAAHAPHPELPELPELLELGTARNSLEQLARPSCLIQAAPSLNPKP